MSSWFLAPSLVTLRDEINARYPKRDKASDGAVGDTSHAARKSSHNPLWSAPGNWSGVVRAIDVDNNGKPGERTKLVSELLAATIGDPRVWYVIWNRQIWSRTYGWKPQRYDGANPHDHHVHVSLREVESAWSDTSRWLAQPISYKPMPAASAVAWNMKVGRRRGVYEALDAIAVSGTRLIGLMEIPGHWPTIREWCKARGWSIVTGEGDPGSTCAYLVKHYSGHRAGGVVNVKARHRGPKGKVLPGRPIVWEKATVDGRPTLDIIVHQVWNPKLNLVAKRRIALATRKLAADNPDRDVYIRGDFNERASTRAPWSAAGTAKKIGGRFIATGAAVDLVIFRPALTPTPEARHRPVPTPVAVKGAKYDSDHPAVGTKNGARR